LDGALALKQLEFISHPPCRKSPELHSLVWPNGEEKIIAFGGKGFIWKCRGKGCKTTEDANGDGEEEEKALRARALRAVDEEEVEDLEEAPTNEDEEDEQEEGAPAVLELAKKLRPKVTMFGDTWTFNLTKSKWSKAALVGDSPRPRWKPSSTVLLDKKHLVLFGGCKSTWVGGVMNDLWFFKPTSDGSGIWTQVFTANPPIPRRGHITVANSTHLIVMGGKGYDPKTGKTHVLTDVWSIPLESLTKELEADVNNFALMDSSLEGKSKKKMKKGLSTSVAWTQLESFPGAPRWGATGELLTRQEDGKELLALFGGRHLNKGGGFHSVDANAYTYYNELWFYDFQANKWTVTNPSGVTPHTRDHHGSTEMDGNLYVFGGRVKEMRSADAVRNDLWSYSLDTESWTEHEAEDGMAPTPRYMPGVTSTKWKGKDAIAVFGGENLPGSTKTTSLNDVWVYDGENWHQLAQPICSADGPETKKPQELLENSAKDQNDAELEVASLSLMLLAGVFLTGFLAFAGGFALPSLRQRWAAAAAERDARQFGYISVD